MIFYKISKSLSPDSNTQQNLLQNYQDKINLAEQQEKQTKEKEQEIEEYLYGELGIEIVDEKKGEKGLLRFVRLSELQEWSFAKQSSIFFSSKYEIIKLEKCCSNFKNGVNFKKSQFGKGVKFINVKDVYTDKIVNINDLDRIDIDQNQMYKNQVENNDLIFVRSSVKYEGVGFPSLIKTNNQDEKVTFCGFIIKCSINTSIINPDFLLYILRSKIIRNIVIKKSNKSTITNISQPELKKLNIPFPSLEIQTCIANHIQNLKNEIKTSQTRS